MSNIFKRWFSNENLQDIDNDLNPWAGLASYEDPETVLRKLKFCGRDDDSYDLTRLIISNVFVTLYGKSGIGKTSLLNAGVFPELRKGRYTPMSLRLSLRDEECPHSYQSMIVDVIEQTIKRTETINVIDEQVNQQNVDYLWNYFVRHRFYNKYDEPTIPVIVLDQFEEVFRSHRDETETLLRQLDYLNDKDNVLDFCNDDCQTYRYEQNYRFVVSIREDDLYRLEDSIDNCYIPSLKRCRYRLRSLSYEGASEVILIPGEGLFDKEEQNDIVNTIIGIARNKEDNSINTNILSLVCSRIYVNIQKEKTTNHLITLSLVDSFLKCNPFERFYNEATQSFSQRTKELLEEGLVTEDGRRTYIEEMKFLHLIPNGEQLIRGKNRILQRVSISSDRNVFGVELIHDSFCQLLMEQKQKRLQKKRVKQLLVILTISLLFLGITTWIIYEMNQRQVKLLINQSRFIAEKASTLVDQEDSYLAQLLLLEVLPKNVEKPNRPYTIEAEKAIWKAYSNNSGILYGHLSPVYSTAFSPDGKKIVSTSWDKTIRIWDVATGKQLKTLNGQDRFNSVSFSPDGKRIVSASLDNTIKIWDAETGKGIKVWNVLSSPVQSNTFAIFEGGIVKDSTSVFSAAFSPDGLKIVSASVDNTIRIWDAVTGNQLRLFDNHTDNVKSVAFSPDGKKIISASEKSINIWDADTGNQLCTIKSHTTTVKSVSFSPDGKNVVSVLGKSIIVTDVATGEKQIIMNGHEADVCSAFFSPDGTKIVSSSWDNTIRIWNAKTGKELIKYHGFTDLIGPVYFSPDGKKIIFGKLDNTIIIKDVEMEKGIIITEGGTESIISVAFSSDGKRILTTTEEDNNIIWNVETGQKMSIPYTNDFIYALSSAFSPDGKRILLGLSDNNIIIWDVEMNKELKILTGHTAPVYSVVYSQDGNKIVSASGDKSIIIWDSNNGHKLMTLKGHTNSVNSVAASMDGRKIVSTSEKSIIIWDAIEGKKLRYLIGHKAAVVSASFSPDGKKIVSASWDNTIRIWDAETGKELICMKGHTDVVKSVIFSPDGKRILSTSNDGTIRIWDVATGIELRCLEEYDYFASASFCNDGKRILSILMDGSIITWDNPSLQELIDTTHERFKNRSLTPEERRKYYLE